MQKIFTVLFLLVLSSSIFAQKNEDSYKISFPSYIAVNSSFDISLVTTNRFAKADTLEFYILPDEKLNLNRIDLNTLLWKSGLSFKPALLEGYSGPVYKSTVNLTDSAFSPGSFFQFLIRFRNDNTAKSIVKFFGIYKEKGKVLGYINSKIKDRAINESDYLTVPLEFYKVQRVAGRALNFTHNAYLDFSFSNIKSENLLTEFWIKLNNPEEQMLKIKNKNLPEFQYSLSTNSFQILSAESKSGSQVYSNPCFLSLKCWYHISILFSIRNNTLSFYSNGRLIAKYKLNYSINAEDLSFEFYNFEEKESFQIDLLRVIDLNNSINTSFANSNFQNFTADSSKVLARIKVDDISELSNLQGILELNISGVQIVNSDAPIFAKAPELNIKMLSSSYELEWKGGDYKQADYYILEKSSQNSEYIPLVKIDADNLNEKNYTCLDQKDESSDVIYYRVKQVDNDGSVVYSSQVKVGQGLFEPFVVEQNFPNPFNPKTSIVVELLEDSEVKVIVYNLEGKEIARLHDGLLNKGVHKFTFDATDLPSGVYLYKIETPDYSQTKKMVLTK
jgi:Secretion system C-terminal sorting domain